ncbi:high-affinity branched-chain amino acid ABC transporter permease LivH [Neptunomonas phycophila]|jgi:branched-chain amino acid transport system permease protein|uniref:High-affinity branched-chain amino acid ABC transporter permease LivH n=1 Tax=Neptunomonas phycophila TaxID=1572645 RepID=A0AAW7XLA7_9GAMM|nr:MULTISPECIES: high-affinity branched-chain amino acid ABC transporter permease LivH [Neptunomonas]MDN2658319.1 high-affinity branched-chain amino acid ABC transporter permease LivH [Neptunomonas sp. CHC150]MDO6454143.1 high-affinity branched-chain amino acid ABC transporter permease LivH [Neptunomonas phycophila]MDO6468670.1 high-affinity branched-chain amino acid ABC transporter permease LivH [Neptunomonas phycophila]MDP2523260.1 high-affinity branched-chain amino acid ABC transporter perme
MSETFLYLLQQIINGLTIGSTYALIAIGYTMVYGIIGMINFAHGEIYMIGSYISFIVIAGLLGMGLVGLPIILLVALIVAVIIASTYGWTVERVAYRPLRGSNRLIPLISAIGMSIFLQNYVVLAQGSRDVALPPQITGGWTFGDPSVFEVSFSYMQLIIWTVTVISMTGLTLFISRSRMGRACRACSEDIGMTNLLGIDTNRIIALTFIIGAALAAIAGLLLGLYYGVVNPFVGFMAGLKAFTAAVLGGIGSIPGAMLGGLILGVTEALTSAYFPSEYKDVVSFGLLVLILLFRPSGLLGKPEVEKV